MAIIGVSGKIGSGKDTLGNVIQYLSCNSEEHFKEDIELGTLESEMKEAPEFSEWKIKKFADKLKECISIITGIPRKDLEKIEVKNSNLPEEWNYIFGQDGVKDYDIPRRYTVDERKPYLTLGDNNGFNKMTVRNLLQLFGTEVGRQIHPNFWINALFIDYKPTTSYKFGYIDLSKLDNNLNITAEANLPHPLGKYPDWIITDMRFPNELKAVKERGGITIRINRGNFTGLEKEIIECNQHSSETALDNAPFDYIIENNGTIADLIVKMREIMINEKLL